MAERRAEPRKGFAMAVGVTVWLAGLLIALMLGMGSAYVVVSSVFVGSRVWSRVRASRDESRAQLGTGDPS